MAGMKNNIEDYKYVLNKMRNEGFHYCFTSYSNFEEIDDDKFHELRLKYIKISNELENYIKNKIV
jgi:hypothetical protein